MEGLVTMIIVVLDIFAIAHVVSSTTSTGTKVAWSLLIAVLPVFGLLIWALLGPRGLRTASQ